VHADRRGPRQRALESTHTRQTTGHAVSRVQMGGPLQPALTGPDTRGLKAPSRRRSFPPTLRGPALGKEVRDQLREMGRRVRPGGMRSPRERTEGGGQGEGPPPARSRDTSDMAVRGERGRTTLVRDGGGGSENCSVLDGALWLRSVKRDELGFTALRRRALCRWRLGHGGWLLGGSPGGRHLLVHRLLPRDVGLLRGRQRCVLAGEGAHETL